MRNRIIGFDIARAYAILGMYIVNFTFCFGSFRGDSILAKFSTLFVGNSTSIFIICAGMGVVLMTSRPTLTLAEKKKLRSTVMKRSWFLFALGLALFNWWPGDILHFYGAYLHIAAVLLFVPKRYYLWVAAVAIVGYNLLQLFIPITTSWDMATTQYADFWTPLGFLRNTFYNGWNSIFPWFSFFAVGMFLGKVDWEDKQIRRRIFWTGLGMLAVFKGLRLYIRADFDNPAHNPFYVKYWPHLMEDYFPANIPYIMITMGWALMVISLCMSVGYRFPASKFLGLLAQTGQMTLTQYVLHTTLGMLLLSALTGHTYTGYPPTEVPIAPQFILLYAAAFFAGSMLFSYVWLKKFKKGPLEMLMRKLAG
jgi:uncharacterized protein